MQKTRWGQRNKERPIYNGESWKLKVIRTKRDLSGHSANQAHFVNLNLSARGACGIEWNISLAPTTCSNLIAYTCRLLLLLLYAVWVMPPSLHSSMWVRVPSSGNGAHSVAWQKCKFSMGGICFPWISITASEARGKHSSVRVVIWHKKGTHKSWLRRVSALYVWLRAKGGVFHVRWNVCISNKNAKNISELQ